MTKLIFFAVAIVLCSCAGNDYSEYEKPQNITESEQVPDNHQATSKNTAENNTTEKEWVPPKLKTIYKDPTLIPGDTIRIEIINEASLSKSVRIPSNGKINYQLIKEFKVAGKTLEQVTADLKKNLSDFIEDPLINVNIEVWKERKIYVDGLNSGSRAFTLPNNEVFTISRFLLTIGVSPNTKDVSGVEIIRENIIEDENEDNQGREKLYLPLEVIFENYDTENDIALQPEDLVVLQKKDKVYIQGSIVSPGNYPIAKNESLSLWDLILQANGPRPEADLANIEVIRELEQNKRTTLKISASPKSENLFYVQANDIITINSKKQINNIVSIYGEVRKPGSLAMPEDETRISLVIGLAGGLSEFASSKIRIIRYLDDGTTKKYLVNFDKILQGNQKEDILIKGGDLIIADSGW